MPEANLSVERRRTPRLSVKIPVKYRLEEDGEVIQKIEEWRKKEQNAYTLDMSLGGMSVIVDQPLTVGKILRVDIYLLDQTNVATVYAEVKWANKEGAGVQFLMVKKEELEALRAFLEKASSS